MPADAPWTWDLYCRVVDNFGDAGVCWRLAAQLGARGHTLRLWIDDPRPLAFMAPAGARGVTVLPWPAAEGVNGAAPISPGDVVIEAFGCELPDAVTQALRARPVPPVWINLEYLSAESYVERSHGLPSPQRNGLVKWFFYPGYTDRTGGLLREDSLLAARANFDRDAWLSGQGILRQPGETVVLLFCYPQADIGPVADGLADRRTLWLLTPGPAHDVVNCLPRGLPPTARTVTLPWLTQPDFDHALWSADLNIVRGEDSLVRAMWAGAPWLWNLYPQEPPVLGAKLDALLALLARAGAPGPAEASTDMPKPGLMAGLDTAMRSLNRLPARQGPADTTSRGLPGLDVWRAQVQAWRQSLARQTDLASQLLQFVAGKKLE